MIWQRRATVAARGCPKDSTFGPCRKRGGVFCVEGAMYWRVIQMAPRDGWAGPPPGRPQEPAKLIHVHNAGQGGANAQR